MDSFLYLFVLFVAEVSVSDITEANSKVKTVDFFLYYFVYWDPLEQWKKSHVQNLQFAFWSWQQPKPSSWLVSLFLCGAS